MLLMVVAMVATAAQRDSARTVRIGSGLLGGVSVHVADFSSLPELQSCCPRFRDGSGLSSAAMVWGEYPVAGSIAVGVRIGTATFGGELRSLERKPVLVNDTPADAVIQHLLSSSFRAMRWEGYVTVRASSVLDVYVGVGTDLLQRAEATIREELVQPSQGTFENGQRVRNERTAPLTSSTRAMTSLITGMRFAIGLDQQRRWSLVPELTFRYGLDPIVRSNQWYLYGVLVGIGLAFEPIPYRVIPTPAEVHSDHAEPVPTRPLEASLAAYGMETGQEQLPLRLVRYARVQVMPLHRVLYASGTQLAERYLLPLSPDDSSWRTTLSSPLAVYYATLPIVAERLQRSSDTLRITGYDGYSTARALQRAEFVARYLRAVWKIPPQRLRIEARLDDRDTTARVVFSGTAHLFEPFEYRDTVQQIEPLVLRLRPATNGAEPLRRWSLHLRQDSTILALQQGSGGLPLRVDIDLSPHAERLRSDRALVAQLQAESIQGNYVKAETLIPIEPLSGERQMPRSTIEHYFFSTDRPSAAFVRELAQQYRQRLRDIAIVMYGSSLETKDAADYLRRALLQAGLPEPRIEQQEALYRPITPERILYGNMLVLRIRTLQ